jgi:YVTN family beta-propeller protein
MRRDLHTLLVQSSVFVLLVSFVFPGAIGAYSHALLGGESIANTSPEALSSVSVSPSSDILSAGVSAAFNPIPSCTGNPCPAGVEYDWSLTNGKGALNYTSSNTVITNFNSGGEAPVGIAYDSDNGDIYVTNDQYVTHGFSNVSVISGVDNKVVKKITVGNSPTGIAFDIDNGYLYVANCGSGNMSVIDGTNNSVVASIPVTLTSCTIGSKWYMNYAGVTYDHGNHFIYVSNYANSSVSVVNTSTNSVVKSIAVTGDPWGIAYDPSNGYVYVTDGYQKEVNVIDDTTNQVVDNITVGTNPAGIEYDPANGDIYVANAGNYVLNPIGDGTISVIDGATDNVLTTIPVHGYPWSVTYDSGNGCIYETDSNTTVMNVISDTTNTVIDTIPIVYSIKGSSDDFASLYDGTNGDIYVTGFNYSFVSVIGGASDENTFTAGMNPGEVNLFVNATWDGNTVQSPPVPISIIIAKTFEIEFNESGLPVGVQWYLNVTGQSPVSTSFASLSINLPNGSYSYHIATIDKQYAPGLASASLTVSGSDQFKTVSFALITFPVTFTESGLPADTNWSIMLDGNLRYSATSSVMLAMPNGTYPFIVGAIDHYSASPSPGSMAVSGGAARVAITFTPIPIGQFAVEFVESGLVDGTNWSVVLNATQRYSTSNTVTFSEPNGTYPFAVTQVEGYTASLLPGKVAVNGTSTRISIGFTAIRHVRYTVTFIDGGLPPATPWSTTLNGSTHSSTNSTINFSELNGTWEFAMGSVAGYVPTPSSGTVTVDGRNVSRIIAFAPIPRGMYLVEINETGLPVGANWSATLGEVRQYSTGTTITFTEPNGSCFYTVGVVRNYTASPSSGNLTVIGKAMIINVSFIRAPSEATGGQSSEIGYLVILEVAALALTAIATAILMSRSAKSGGTLRSGTREGDARPSLKPEAEPPNPRT